MEINTALIWKNVLIQDVVHRRLDTPMADEGSAVAADNILQMAVEA